MLPENYQAADQAVLAGWLADATLTTALEAVFDWQGWKASLDLHGAALTEPNIPPALPVAGGSYRVLYPQEVDQYLSGDVQSRRVALDLRIRSQPDANSSAWDDHLTAAEKIKARIRAQKTDAAIPVVTAPLALLPPARDWTQTRLLLNAWMGET